MAHSKANQNYAQANIMVRKNVKIPSFKNIDDCRIVQIYILRLSLFFSLWTIHSFFLPFRASFAFFLSTGGLYHE